MSRFWRSKNEGISNLSASQINDIIDEWILNERDRKILKRRLIDGIRFEPLAEEFKLSERQTKNIVYKGENIIFNKSR